MPSVPLCFLSISIFLLCAPPHHHTHTFQIDALRAGRVDVPCAINWAVLLRRRRGRVDGDGVRGLALVCALLLLGPQPPMRAGHDEEAVCAFASRQFISVQSTGKGGRGGRRRTHRRPTGRRSTARRRGAPRGAAAPRRPPRRHGCRRGANPKQTHGPLAQ